MLFKLNRAKNDSFIMRPDLSSKIIEQFKILWQEANLTNIYAFKSSPEMIQGLYDIGFPKKTES